MSRCPNRFFYGRLTLKWGYVDWETGLPPTLPSYKFDWELTRFAWTSVAFRWCHAVKVGHAIARLRVNDILVPDDRLEVLNWWCRFADHGSRTCWIATAEDYQLADFFVSRVMALSLE
jgi:hypothetical protein